MPKSPPGRGAADPAMRIINDSTYAFRPFMIPQAHLAEHHKAQPDLQVRVSAGAVPWLSLRSAAAPVTVWPDVTL